VTQYIIRCTFSLLSTDSFSTQS